MAKLTIYESLTEIHVPGHGDVEEIFLIVAALLEIRRDSKIVDDFDGVEFQAFGFVSRGKQNIRRIFVVCHVRSANGESNRSSSI